MAEDQRQLFPEMEAEVTDAAQVAGKSDEVDWRQIALDAESVFTPNHPVNEKDLFAGRIRQVSKLVQAVNRLGQHAVLYGERGVGKTSLANVLHQFLSAQATVLAPRVNADSGDTFDSVWRKAFEQIRMTPPRGQTLGFHAPTPEPMDPTELIGGEITPDAVRKILVTMSDDAVPILIFDEFDRLKPKVRGAFADVIKTLSDQAVQATVVLVGVAETIEQLIESHQSVERALVQIPIPRMIDKEVEEIIETGLYRLGFEIEDSAKRRIMLLSQGLPYYTHLVCLHAVLEAAERRTFRITNEVVKEAVGNAIEDAQGTIRIRYHKATSSPRKGNLFPDVLLACALAQPDDLGYFTAQGVVQPLREITGNKTYGVPTFAQHLDDFASARRENVLKKDGVKRRFRYRFSDPLMQPYVVMQGIAKERITEDMLTRVGR